MPSSIEEGAPGGTRKDGRGRPKAPRVSRGRELAAVALGAVSLAAGLGGLLGSGPGPRAASPPAAAGGEAGGEVAIAAPSGARVGGSAAQDDP